MLIEKNKVFRIRIRQNYSEKMKNFDMNFLFEYYSKK